MEWMRSWITSIAGTVIFSTICEILLPDGNMKKYVRVILGMLLVFAVAKPLADFRSTDAPDLGLPVQKSQAYAAHIEMEEVQKAQVMNVYSSNLQKKIKASVEQGCGISGKITDVALNISDKKESFGEIQAISVSILDLKGAGNGLTERAKKYLADEYNVPEKDVKIRITSDKGGS